MKMLISNPTIVLREEFDDWALLYNPGTGKAFGINPMGVFIWKKLDGKHSVEDLIREVNKSCTDVPANVEEQVTKFVETLAVKGLATTINS